MPKSDKQYTLVCLTDDSIKTETGTMEEITPSLAKAREEAGDKFDAEVFVFLGEPIEVTLQTTAVIGGTKKTRLPRKSKAATAASPDAAAVLGAIKASADGKTATLAQILGCTAKDLAPVLAELVEGKKVTRSGQKRGTTYRLVA